MIIQNSKRVFRSKLKGENIKVKTIAQPKIGVYYNITDIKPDEYPHFLMKITYDLVLSTEKIYSAKLYSVVDILDSRNRLLLDALLVYVEREIKDFEYLLTEDLIIKNLKFKDVIEFEVDEEMNASKISKLIQEFQLGRN